MHPKRGFDIQRDFAPVLRIGYGTIVFVVPAASRAASVKEFVALAKASPGKYTFASSGVGALIHLTGEMFQQAAAIELTHVPYKGTTQILPDLLDGRVDMALDSLPAYIPHLSRESCARSRSPRATARPSCPSCRPWPKRAFRA
jgi:tripartite-type tricarboxylate transporter receptor subunit TctC